MLSLADGLTLCRSRTGVPMPALLSGHPASTELPLPLSVTSYVFFLAHALEEVVEKITGNADQYDAEEFAS